MLLIANLGFVISMLISIVSVIHGILLLLGKTKQSSVFFVAILFFVLASILVPGNDEISLLQLWSFMLLLPNILIAIYTVITQRNTGE